MTNHKKLIVSHAPFSHVGSSIVERQYVIMLATMPAVFAGILRFGIGAIAVVCLSVSTAIIWEYLLDRIIKRPSTVADGNAALIGLVFAMLLPATTPWWAILTGTFVAVIVGKQIFGGIGGNCFHPAVLSLAILSVSWPHLFDFDATLVNYDFSFFTTYPLAAVKNTGVESAASLTVVDMLLGRQIGGIGATFGLGLILGGLYLMLRGFVRWEISLSFLVAIAITAILFQMADSARFAGPAIHLFSGYTLIGAFFLLPEDSSSPVNFIPMLIYGAFAGIFTVLVRNIGAYVDGVVYAVLIANCLTPLLDKIRPQALGKVG